MEHDKNDEEEQELQDFQDVLSVTILQNQQDKTTVWYLRTKKPSTVSLCNGAYNFRPFFLYTFLLDTVLEKPLETEHKQLTDLLWCNAHAKPPTWCFFTIQ